MDLIRSGPRFKSRFIASERNKTFLKESWEDGTKGDPKPKQKPPWLLTTKQKPHSIIIDLKSSLSIPLGLPPHRFHTFLCAMETAVVELCAWLNWFSSFCNSAFFEISRLFNLTLFLGTCSVFVSFDGLIEVKLFLAAIHHDSFDKLIWMGTGEESTAKPSKPTSTSSTQVPLTPSYPDWSSSMQAYYAHGPAPPPFFASNVASPTPHPYLWGSQHHLIPPYGTPVPYPAIYPPGSVYAHPSMAMTPGTTQNASEFVGKGPDGKDGVSTKSSKGMSANAGSKAVDNGKEGSGSGNDGISQSVESGSEGSSDASDENTNQQESATNMKGSFDQMLVDGANAQNNSVGAISQSSVPGKPVVSMSATNLNIGMDLWSASPASAEAAKIRHNQSATSGAATPPTIMGREVALGEQWIQDERELKRQKRKQSNRESARRSRLRKQAECEELLKRVESLGSENRTLREELQRASEECKKLTSENNSIKEELERLCGPEAVANLE
ncbi:hypothetical protein VNO77_40730 [Canavalia gladiata]|uniref:BZIP domain-containing protein n=1 Tax=Canavalia gladiata TaxID=3824 RepID=A0AAN9JZ57_CANGL